MKRSTILDFSAITVLGVVVLTTASVTVTSGAEIKCMCSVALKPAFDTLLRDFEKMSGHKVILAYETFGALTDRIQKGEATDVAIVGGQQIDSLQQQGMVVVGSRRDIAKVGIGAYVRKGYAKPDLGSVDSFKRALLAAKSISYVDPAGGGGTGIYLASLIDRLGIGTDMKPKTKLYRDYALDGPLYTDVADGKVDFGLVPISEAKAAPSVEYAGPIPAEVQLYVLFSSGIGTSSKHAELGEALVQFITLPAAQAFFQSKGFDPP